MSDKIILPTSWEIRHTDPIAPGQIVLRMLNGTGIQTFTFDRQRWLEFVAQADTVAAAIRAGTV